MSTLERSPFDVLVRAHAVRTPEKLAIAGSVQQTWAALAAAVDTAEAWLVWRGVGPGDRIGYLGPNSPAAVALVPALLRVGAVFVGLNPRHGTAEQERNVAAVRPKLVVVHESVSAPIQAALAPLTEIVRVGAYLPEPSGDVHVIASHEVLPDDAPAVLYFTSGSSGTPKAVSISRGANAWAALETAPASMSADTVALVVPTIAHVAGMMWTQHLLACGGTLVFAPVGTPRDLAEVVSRERITHALMVPTLISMLVEGVEAAGREIDLSQLREVCYGTAPITSALLVKAMRLLDCDFTQMYGATEAGGVLTSLAPSDHRTDGPHVTRLLSAGRPIDGVEVRIVNPVTGDDSPVGTEGEIVARLPSLMTEYWQDPAQTTSALDLDGWLHLRDMGRLDQDGYLFVSGRLDDVIITGGENVHPGEVEEFIASLPGVVEVAVFGISSPKWGQEVCACVVLASDSALAAGDVIARCRDQLTHFKCPTQVEIVDELPRTPNGKVSRAILRRQFNPPTA